MTYRQAKDLKMLPINSMNPTNTPPQLVDFITLSEVSSICEIDESELMDLVDYGAIHYHHFLNVIAQAFCNESIFCVETRPSPFKK